MTEETLFLAALDKRNTQERDDFLDDACDGDDGLRQRVDEMLRIYEAGSEENEGPSANGNNPALAVTKQVGQPRSPLIPDSSQRLKTIADRYLLIEPIGEGGMGTVWLAEQFHPVQRRVAIKLIRTGLDCQELLHRFEAERQALALMEHPNVAKVLDGGVAENGMPFFVMELVPGFPLGEFCANHHLSLKERLSLFVRICQAVQHAHHKGIIHRDLKPSNILVSVVDGVPNPKIIDFGIAKATHGRLTQETHATEIGAVMGTLEYMSPEQAGLHSDDTDTRSDVYSLGVILYEMLTGLRPFDSSRLEDSSLDQVLQILREEEPPRPSQRLASYNNAGQLAGFRDTDPRKLSATLRGDLDWIVMKCLEKDRRRRFESASDLCRDVERYLKDEPVEARPPSAAYRVKKFVRKNKAFLSTTAAFVLLLLIGTAVSTWQAVRATMALETAEQKEQEARVARTEAEKKENEARAARKLAEKNATDALNAMLLAKKHAKKARDNEIKAIENAKQAKINAEKALKREEYAQASFSLLESVFLRLNPDNESRDNEELHVVIGKSLDEAVERLDKENIGNEAADSRIRTVLGVSLLGLGYPRKAIPLLSESLKSHRRLRGEAHDLTIQTLNLLGTAYSRNEQLEEAQRHCEEALALQNAHYDKEDGKTILIMSTLATIYAKQGKYERALTLLRTAHELSKDDMTDDKKQTLVVMRNIGTLFSEAEQLDQALPVLKEAYDSKLKLYGKGNFQLFLTRANLAYVYYKLGDWEKALTLSENGLQLARSKLGNRHRVTLLLINNLADVYRAYGQAELAVALQEETYRATLALYGPDDKQTLERKRLLDRCIRYLHAKQKGTHTITELNDWKNGVQGEISAACLPDTENPRDVRKSFLAKLEAGDSYQIDMTADFSGRLRVESEHCTPIVWDDFGSLLGRGRRRVVFTPDKTATYRIVAHANKKEKGKFELTLKKIRAVHIPKRELALTDSTRKTREGQHYQVFKANFSGGVPCVIEVRTDSFDANVLLFDEFGKKHISSGTLSVYPGNRIYRIQFTPPKIAKYTVVISGKRPGQTGSYTLQMHRFLPLKNPKKK